MTNKMNWDPVTHYRDVAVAERYDRERFSRLSGRTFSALEKHNVSKAFKSIPRGATLLDLPCGTGRLAEPLLEAGFKVVGVDISPAMLEVARRRLARFGDRFQTEVGDARELAKQQPKKYDAALCARVLMHFPLQEQIAFLKGVADLTRGVVVFTQSLSTPYHRFRRQLKRAIGNQPPAVHPITEAQLRELLRGAGLKEIGRLRPMPLLTESIFVIAAHV